MLNRSDQVERTAAAGQPRAHACGAAVAGAIGAVDRGWTFPSTLPVMAAKHDLTPAPRPEEAVPR